MQTQTSTTKTQTPQATPEPAPVLQPRRLTEMGTPCSPAWDADWIATIEATEIERGKRICGARTLSGKPCLLDPNHENGRCRYHGGFNLTGAQPGNRNAVIHGLYSRCIQTCGPHCPMWDSCPCSGDDVRKLDPKDRPHCPYETAHYETAVTDNLARMNVPVDADPRRRHSAYELAMVQVMVMRAASAMAVNDLLDVRVNNKQSDHAATKKVGAYTEAFLRLSSEFRRLYALFKKENPGFPTFEARKEQNRRAHHDTSLLEEDRAQLDPNYTSLGWNANEKLKSAISLMSQRSMDSARKYVTQARDLDPAYTDAALDPASPLYIPEMARLADAPQSTAALAERGAAHNAKAANG